MRQEEHTSSIRDIPDFPAPDIFCGGATAPYRGFGDVIDDSGALESKLHADAAQVRKDVRETFRVELGSSNSIPIELDKIMEKMWATGWDPRVETSICSRVILVCSCWRQRWSCWAEGPFSLAGRIYTSTIWPGVEAFPFHKAFKCLTETDGESMTYFVRGVAHELEAKGLLKPGRIDRSPKAD
jgi:hypothetical protein